MVRDYGDRIQFIGMGAVDTADAISDFVSVNGLNDIPAAIDEDGSLRVSLGVPGHPAWVFVDEGGDATIIVGTIFRPRLFELLDELVAS